MEAKEIIKILQAYSFKHHHEGVVLSENWFEEASLDILKILEVKTSALEKKIFDSDQALIKAVREIKALQKQVEELKDLLNEIINNKDKANNSKDLYECLRSISKAAAYLNQD